MSFVPPVKVKICCIASSGSKGRGIPTVGVGVGVAVGVPGAEVVVAAQVLGAAVNHDVDPQLVRVLVNG